MKNTTKYLLLLLVPVLLLVGCKPEDPVLGEPGSKLEGINDSFILTKVVQVDNITSEFENTMDISTAFIGDNPSTISFDSEAFSFTYDPGSSPDYIGAAGTWAFDDNDYPTKITMDVSGTTYDLALLRTIRPQDNELSFQLDRTCGTTPTVSYQYTFERN